VSPEPDHGNCKNKRLYFRTTLLLPCLLSPVHMTCPNTTTLLAPADIHQFSTHHSIGLHLLISMLNSSGVEHVITSTPPCSLPITSCVVLEGTCGPESIFMGKSGCVPCTNGVDPQGKRPSCSTCPQGVCGMLQDTRHVPCHSIAISS
jgi:hypothetical protein